ncbi:hypothetical protein [Cellulomonas triticagri]|uniref:Uncharacterized protein n=1 Tax=Cellulomonas triticagri TaxID=2483352 RepID=A0A3M2JC44_9CELL|nr:hypothetical protein [Cellulomonas triticagri]RMI09410.1 hypothetical protein EBM89_10475 [Cellulomonas triticagri]
MPLFSRRPALPDAVRRALHLAPGDRVLASAAVPGDRWFAASREALHLVDGETVTRHPWTDVDRASFAPEPPAITVHWVTGAVQEIALTPPIPVAFAQIFRERVQQSVVHVETVTPPRSAPVRVVLRRGEGGDLFTQVIGPGTVDVADPHVRAVLEDAEERVRAAAGLRG